MSANENYEEKKNELVEKKNQLLQKLEEDGVFV